MNILEEIQNCPVEWKELEAVVETVTCPIKLTKDEYIIFGDHSEHAKYVDFAFIQEADGLKILKPNSGIKAKYLYYCFCNFYKREGSYKRHWSKARTTLIPIPPLKIQEKIVQILDKFTDYVTELSSELTAGKK